MTGIKRTPRWSVSNWGTPLAPQQPPGENYTTSTIILGELVLMVHLMD